MIILYKIVTKLYKTVIQLYKVTTKLYKVVIVLYKIVTVLYKTMAKLYKVIVIKDCVIGADRDISADIDGILGQGRLAGYLIIGSGD